MELPKQVNSDCNFCDPNKLQDVIIKQNSDFTSFVSNPWFRSNHLLVVPAIHVEKLSELPTKVLAKIMGEAALLADMVDDGFGTVTLQKYQPLQAENGIKMNHLHVHVWPRIESDTVPIPVPTFEDFSEPSAEEVEATQLRLNYLRRTLFPRDH